MKMSRICIKLMFIYVYYYYCSKIIQNIHVVIMYIEVSLNYNNILNYNYLYAKCKVYIAQKFLRIMRTKKKTER